MRATLCAVLVTAAIAGSFPSPVSGQAAAKPILKADQGFSLNVPAGWTTVADPDAAAAMVRADNRRVRATVFVGRKPAPTEVTETLSQALSAISGTAGQTLVSSSFDVYLDRPALIAVYEDATTRYRMVFVPRDFEERSQVYYGITVAAPKASFAKLAAAIDRVFTGFTILDRAAATTAGGGLPAVSASPVSKDFDRDAAIERILSPLRRPRG